MIKCNICGKEITRSDDVNVLALLGFVPKNFCNNCYAKRERGVTRNLFYMPPKYPLNSTLFTVCLVIISIIILVFLIAILFNFGESNIKTTFGKIIFAFVLLLIGAWQWALWIIARGRVKKAQIYR